MILFFHFICLLARYMVLSISKTFTRPKVLSDEHLSEITSLGSYSENCSKRTLEYTQYPIYDNGSLKFFPPVYIQRYETVAFVLQDPELGFEIRKVVDFGCAELGFFAYLKSIEGITEILEVDLNSDVLERYSFKAAPLTSDYLMRKREKPLDVYILAGNVSDYDDHLMNCDAVIAIELIEHLSPGDLEKMPYNIFYKIKPKIAIFTTPNADFNSLLPNFTDKRHKDHKFEWNRKEFFKWTQQILSVYPEYNVRFFGIGAGPEGTENLGCCTQMAVFKRLDDAESFVTSRDKLEGIQKYKLIKHYEFPAYIDHRTTEEKIIHEIQYRATYLKTLDTYYNFETNKSEIPLSLLKEYVSEFQFSDKELMNILRNRGMNLIEKSNSWFIVYSDTESVSSDSNVSGENWLSEDIPINESCDQSFEEKWSDEEQAYSEELNSQAETRLNFSQKLSLNGHESKLFQEEDQEYAAATNQKSTSISENSNCLLNTEKYSQESPNFEDESPQIKKPSLFKSKIACRMRDTETEFMRMRRKNIFHVCKPFKKISKSISLDSCLENINSKPSEPDSRLNSIPISSSPFIRFSPTSSFRSKRVNCSDSSLFSNSLDKGGDSGYPFSFSVPNGDSTPEEVDEILTENEMSWSTSLSSEIDMDVAFDRGFHHVLFIENVPVENEDVANNNRDREGNNVEGLLGQRIDFERDLNDN